MDALLLSRLQFGFTAMFHFLFVPLTLGLSVIVAIMETIYVRTGNEVYKDMARFWGRLFIINFAVGVVSGIALEFQFGTNWPRFSAYVGDVFGPLLAIEATASFFLESTFLAVWIFGWKRISPRLHALCIWLVAGASTVSAYWIMAANSWMQHPVGYAVRNGRAELTDFIHVITQYFLIVDLLHVVSGAFALSGFFVLGVSAYHLIRKQNTDFFTRSFRIAAYFALFSSLLVAFEGDQNGIVVAQYQPAKFAAMESLWETTPSATQYLLLIPDENNERNRFEIGGIPGGLSLLAFHDYHHTVMGLKEWAREDRPPVLPVFLSFRIMVGLGFFFIALAAAAVVYVLPGSALLKVPGVKMLLFFTKWYERYPWLLWVFVLSIPLPYVAIELGWVVAEVGRQPWLVYNVLRVSDGSAAIAPHQAAASFIGFILIFSALGIVDFFLLFKYARRGPGPAAAAPTGGP
ncbi:MAG TPA: cytochrome ubiquinol oxidase subunit I [bacterium]|nr:cytochrome ubiquinol oxidase subunit I [bacterium]